MERLLAGLFQSGKYHSDNPEEDDIVTGYQNVCRIEIIQFFGLIRPAKGRERPQCRREPGIQSILILFHMGTSTLRALLWHLFCYHHLSALFTVVRRDTVSPPELTGNTPVTDAFQPVHICLSKTFRNEFQSTGFQRLNGRFCKLIHFYKPLRFDQRFYGRFTTVMSTYIVYMICDFYKKSHLIQFLNDSFSCLVTIHACINAAIFIDGGIIIHDVDFRQVMAFSNFKIVWVMSRCNLHTAGTKLFIYIFISNDRNLFIYDRKQQCLSDNILISLIFRVYSNCRISQHSLRTGRSDLYETAFLSDDRIFDVPEMSGLLHMLNFRIRDRCLTYRAPVDDTGTFVDISFFVQTDKYFLDCF